MLVREQTIFISNLYTKFKAPNSDQIMDSVNLHVQLDDFDDHKFEWGKRCDINRILLKILEAIAIAGMVVFLGFLFLIELIDLFIVRPIYQKLFKKKRRRRRV